MKFSLLTRLAICVVALSTRTTLPAALYPSDWIGPLTGEQVWENASNWDLGESRYPSDDETDTFRVRIINDGVGALTVATPFAPTTILGFRLDNVGEGATLLKLGNNFTVTAGGTTDAEKTRFYNTSGADQLVIDLNGYQFSANGAANRSLMSGSRNYTIRDTSVSGNGIFILPNITHIANESGNVYVENNVTVKLTQRAQLDARGTSPNTGWHFSRGSTLWLAAEGEDNGSYSYFTEPLGNLVIGGTDNETALRINFGSNMVVMGDVLLNGAKNGHTSYFRLAASYSIKVGGNFTDRGTSPIDYAISPGSLSMIVFNGGRSVEKAVDIHRQHLTTSFYLGENSTSLANVRLLNDLRTTANNSVSSGYLRIREGSRLNLNGFDAIISRLELGTNSSLAYTFGGTQNSLIHVTSSENADFSFGSGITLEFHYNGDSWANGDDLMLIRYERSPFASGLLSRFSTLVLPEGMTHDGLALGTFGGSHYIYLQNVQVTSIPEPTTFLLFGSAVLAFQLLRRWKRR